MFVSFSIQSYSTWRASCDANDGQEIVFVLRTGSRREVEREEVRCVSEQS